MNEVTGTDVMNADAANASGESGVAKYVAIGVATVLVAVGTGLGFLVGNKRGVKKGEAAAAAKLEAAVTKVTETVQAATGTSSEAPATK